MRVLGISGSLRRDSFNSALLRAAAERLPGGVEFVAFERLAEIPIYDADLEEGGPAPDAVAELREAMRSADAVLVSTPEYNHSIPGGLKNALDWASRPAGESALMGTPAAVIGASTGMFGAVWAQAETRKSSAPSAAGCWRTIPLRPRPGRLRRRRARPSPPSSRRPLRHPPRADRLGRGGRGKAHGRSGRRVEAGPRRQRTARACGGEPGRLWRFRDARDGRFRRAAGGTGPPPGPAALGPSTHVSNADERAGGRGSGRPEVRIRSRSRCPVTLPPRRSGDSCGVGHEARELVRVPPQVGPCCGGLVAHRPTKAPQQVLEPWKTVDRAVEF